MIGRGLAHWQIAAPVLALVTVFVAVIWASIVAAALSALPSGPLRRAVEPVLGTRGLVALGLTSIVLCTALLMALRP